MDELDRQSSHSAAAAPLIGSNDDLLTEILLLLPVISILRFKCVSKQWRSLLSHPTFTRRYDTRHFRKSPLGLFFGTNNQYVSFDDEDRSNHPLPLGLIILQSCNGLLLCSSFSVDSYDRKYYVFNPTTRQRTIIPPVPGRRKAVRNSIRFMGLAYHQTECVHYKVVCILKLKGKHDVDARKELFQIQIYSSDTREWKITIRSFSAALPIFGSGVYWNGAIHWALSDLSYMYFKFDVEKLHSLPLPVEVMSLSKTMMRYLGESRGHLHLIAYDIIKYNRDMPNNLLLKVYEMSMDHSGWFSKYHVELDRLKKLQGDVYLRVPNLYVIDVVRGEKDDDTFVVLHQICGYHWGFIMYNVHGKSFKRMFKFNRYIPHAEAHLCANSFPRYSQTLASV